MMFLDVVGGWRGLASDFMDDLRLAGAALLCCRPFCPRVGLVFRCGGRVPPSSH
jgi:hypothetical protein